MDIQAKINECKLNGCAEIVIPAGVHLVSPLNVPIMPAALDLTDLHNITIRGAGMGRTIIKLDPAYDWANAGNINTHILHAIGVSNLTLSDLTLDGSWPEIKLVALNIGEHMHGLYLAATSSFTSLHQAVDNVTVQRVEFTNMRGDGIYMVGDGGQGLYVSNVAVKDSRFVDNGRNGASHQRLVRHLTYDGNYFIGHKNSAIDFEPSGTSSNVEYITIRNNTIDQSQSQAAVAVSLSGMSLADPLRYVDFSHNAVISGSVEGIRGRWVTIANNTISSGTAAGFSTLYFRRYRDLLIIGNTVTSNKNNPAIHVLHDSGELSSDVTIVNNQVYQNGNANGIHTETVSNLSISGNRIYRAYPTTGNFAIYARATAADTENIMIHDNMVLNGGGQWNAGVRLLADPFGFGLVSVQSSIFPGANNKVVTGAGVFNPAPYVADNV